MAILVSFYHFLQLKKKKIDKSNLNNINEKDFSTETVWFKASKILFGLIWFLVFDSYPSSFKYSCLDKNLGGEPRLFFLDFDQSAFHALNKYSFWWIFELS